MSATQRAVDAAVGMLWMAAPLVLSSQRWRRDNERRSLWKALTIYAIALSAALLFGILVDDGFGLAFLPLMILTAPWSFILPVPMGDAIGGSGTGTNIPALIETFMLLVVVCGGLNVVLITLLVRKVSPRRGDLSILK